MTCPVQITINYEANFSFLRPPTPRFSFLRAPTVDLKHIEGAVESRYPTPYENQRRRIAKLIFLWLLLDDSVCLLLLLSAHISYLSGAKLYFPVSLCAELFLYGRVACLMELSSCDLSLLKCQRKIFHFEATLSLNVKEVKSCDVIAKELKVRRNVIKVYERLGVDKRAKRWQ